MAAITASMVGELRAKTDAPMMECKKALTEADGDMEKAEELLRVKLGNKAGKAASRITAEGVVAASVEGTTGAMRRGQLRDRLRHQERQLPGLRRVARRAGRRRTTRPTSPRWRRCRYSQDGFGPTLEDVRKGLIGKIGENMTIPPLQALRRRRQARELPARHAHRRGRRVRGRRRGRQGRRDARRRDEAGRAAAADVPADLIEKERARRHRQGGRGRARTPKPPASRCSRPRSSPSASRARVQKYLKEVSLLNQAFVKNDKQTVEQMLKAAKARGSRASRSTWWARASRRRSTTSPPKSRRRWPPPRAADRRGRSHAAR